MLTDKGNIVIPKQPVKNAENYELLRKTGLNYIQQFSGKVWTDYNVHDPGITIMELLCYALTDLAYRTSFPVADILTDKDAKGPDPDDFFTAKKILTSHPITMNDYRKLLLDHIPAIRNAWFETLDETNYDPNIYFDQKTVTTVLVHPPANHPFEILQLKGLYRVKLEVEDYILVRAHHPHFLRTLAKFRDKSSVITSIEALPSEIRSCITNYTKSLLLDNRNLCEDFVDISIADEEWVAVCTDIELKPDADPDEVFKELFSLLYNYVNPAIQFYSFAEMIEKGRRTEDIFNGPPATRGFIDEDELNDHGHKEVLYVSDIINLLMDIPGILQIKNIHLSSYKKDGAGNYTILEDAQQYCLHLHDIKNSVFQFMMDAGEQDKTKIFNHIRFSKGAIYFSPERKPEYADPTFIDYPALPQDFEDDLPIPAGKNRNLTDYYSLQNDFPLCYYTGMDGIPNAESDLRKSQRLQSKAFLLFFDQLLADYLAQLNNLKHVFTWQGGAKASTLVSLPLEESVIKDLRKLLASNLAEDADVPDEDYFKQTYDWYEEVLETPTQQKMRRSKLLDHLLARFNELFVDYSVFKFKQNKQGDFFNANPETIADKIQFLKVYPQISGKRSHAFNYTLGLYATTNVTGLQLRLQKMLGLDSTHNKVMVKPTNAPNYKAMLQKIADNQVPGPGEKLKLKDNRFANYDKTFGMHILEHILLRPLYKKSSNPLNKLLPLCGDGSNNQHADCLLSDNFSMLMTVVLPGWLALSNNMDYRSYTENLIRSEAPAHVAVKICWLDPARMYLFEKTTEELFKQMQKIMLPGATVLPANILAYNLALNDVYTMMGTLKNMYLPSILDECENINYEVDDEDQIKVPVILDHSALGSDGKDEWYEFK